MILWAGAGDWQVYGPAVFAAAILTKLADSPTPRKCLRVKRSTMHAFAGQYIEKG